ncbi:MAG: hypothetical protein IPL53_04835 [Ignavibacteria bacterium]|nr:hypothetical protein [Ignavibacteria bacterium]
MNTSLLYKLYPLLLTFVLLSCDCNQAINRHPYEYQPDISEGGRIVSISKSPAKDNDILAASESGGLFISRTYGKSWEHLNLPVFEMVDAKFSQTDPNVIIATCMKDLKVTNGGGIWRSNDAGKSWSKPPSSEYTGIGAQKESDGFAIAIEPGTQKVFVGTENGVAMSNDNGITWTFNTLTGGMFGFPRTVYSILAPGGGYVLATTETGVYKTTDGGLSWKKTFSNSKLNQTRLLCPSPSNKQNVFLAANDYKIYYSYDFGSNWKEINSPGGSGREPFIRCTSFPVLVFGNWVNVIYLYYGAGVDLYRKILPDAERPDIFFGNGWDRLEVTHSDPSDMIFYNDGKPLLLSGDGGLFNSNDDGRTFTFVGGGNHGLNALQINEVTAQTNFDDEKRDLVYFGTQDNYFWWSGDGGKIWSAWGNEGHSIETKRQAIGKKGNLMTFADNGAGKVYSSDYGFQNVAEWNHPSPKPVNDPMLIVEGDILDPEPRNRFIELTNAATDTNPLTNFNNTYDGGKTWQFKGSMNFNASSNNPQVSSSSGSPVVYQSISLTETTPQGWGKIGLVRMSNLNQVGNGLLERADLNGFGSLGIFPTMFKWYNVLGVNPNNSNHVIIADVANSKIKVTWDGGKNWFDDDEITELVTAYGTYKFYAIVDCCPKIIVTCINFNPADPNQIAIGTRENGLFMSWDKGESWFPVNDTKRITNPSRIFFYFDNSLLVSTYGRGLWKFTPVKRERPPRPFGRLKGSYIFELNKNSAKRLEANFSDSEINHDSKIVMFNDSLFKIDLKYLRSNRFKQLKINNITVWDLNQQFIKNADYIDITFPETSDRENPEFDAIQIRGIIVNPNNEAAQLILSREPYKLFTADQLLVKELKEPYIELRK